MIDVIREEQMSIVFAVTKEMNYMYQNLADLLPSAKVGELSSDSKNIVEIIRFEVKNFTDIFFAILSSMPSTVFKSSRLADSTDLAEPK